MEHWEQLIRTKVILCNMLSIGIALMMIPLLSQCVPLKNVYEYQNKTNYILEPDVSYYLNGGDADSFTLNGNVAAWQRQFLRAKRLMNVSLPNTHLDFFGIQTSIPIFVGPWSLQRIFHPDGEVATAQAAAQVGTICGISMGTTSTFEEIVAGVTRVDPNYKGLFFQLYIGSNLTQTAAVVQKAESFGIRGFFLTVDSASAGTLKPRDRPSSDQMQAIMAAKNLTSHYSIPTLVNINWSILEWLKGITKKLIIVKGILSVEEALEARARGAHGIVVSNHGGRDLDTSVPTALILPEIAAALKLTPSDNNDFKILVDGGIRRGIDVIKAIAMGADAVMIGRAAAWGLTVDGQQGVKDVLELLYREMSNGMKALGLNTLDDIKKSSKALLWSPPTCSDLYGG